MKTINVRFEQAAELKDIEVVVRASGKDGEVSALIDRISSPGGDTIAVSAKGTTDVVPASDIVLLTVDGKTVNIITETDRFIARQPLNSIEPSLDSRRFVRISRYEIVNLSKVVRYDFTLAGSLRIELVGGMETWASRRCIPEIRRRLSGKE